MHYFHVMGYILIIEVKLIYKKQGFYGDRLKIQISVSELYNFGFELFYLITNFDTNEEVARVTTGMVCYNHKDNKIKELYTNGK